MKCLFLIEDVGGWQFLEIEAAGTLCMVYHQRSIFPEKNSIIDPSKNHILCGFDH